MGAVKSAYIEIMTRDLCGSCRFYKGDPISGNLIGFCPVDGTKAGAQNNPCKMYEPLGGHQNAN